MNFQSTIPDDTGFFYHGTTMAEASMPEPGLNDQGPIRTAVLTSDSLSSLSVADVLDPTAGTALVIGFVSPHCDFAEVAKRVRASVPDGTEVLLITSAGELCGDHGSSPYYTTGATWNRVVLAGFSRALFAEIAVYSVPLPNEDIRSGRITLNNDDRISHLHDKLKNINPTFQCDYRDTFVLTFVDGVSNSENYLLEAIYKSNLFPLFFVGGSAGGTFDFNHTYIFDGKQVLENHAILCFVKLAAGMRYSVFKTQNFRRTAMSFVIADANPELRIVRTVISPSSFKSIPFIDALADALGCSAAEVDTRLGKRTFGVEVGGELYVRSIATLNHTDGSASFYCDVDFGDCLYLLEPTDFVTTTRDDFHRFMQGKPKPLGALLNDCVLRRVNNEPQLQQIDAFRGIPLAGFSTFGELMGLNINQTLTAIFFFPDGEKYSDDMIDRFPIHYSSFCSYFDRRAANRLRTLDGLRQEQEKIRRQLRREHEFSQALLGSLPGIFFLLNASGNLVLWNVNMLSITGLSSDILMLKPATDLVCSDDRLQMEACIARAFADGRSGIEARFLAKGGELTPHYITALRILLEGEPYITVIGIDITERKQIEAALQASRQQLKMITDSLAESILVVDQAGRVAFANPAANQLLECPATETLEGHLIETVFRLETNDKKDGASPWLGVIADKLTVRSHDATVITVAGQHRPIAYTCAPLTDGDTQLAAVISFHDIQALKEAQREAIQASRLASVGQLAAGIAHEINTPVQYVGDNLHYVEKSLAKFADVVEAGRLLASQAQTPQGIEDAALRFEKAFATAKIPTLTTETQDAIRESLDGVTQIGRIVLSMKEFSHPGTSTKTTTDINKALESTLIVSRNEWKHAAEIEKNLDPQLPPIICHAGEMNQVFLNLIVNATHAIESSGKPLPGRITISTAPTDGGIEIRVADTGTGIPEPIREKIFDPFFTTKEVGKGTGQGLAICRDVVVTKHGGTLDVRNRESGGAEFIIFLPVGKEDPHIEDDEK